jgi:hypothetical protein
MRVIAPIVVASGIAFVVGCGGPPPDGCPPSISATGKEHRIPHPKESSTCKAVVMTCNACVYDAQGAFVKTEGEACGVCVGADF